MMVDPFTEPLQHFQVEIGRFVIHFCSLEWVAFEALARLEPEGFKANRWDKLEIHARVLKLIEVSRERARGQDRDEWLKLWERVSSLVQDRKKILHNPIMIDVWSNDDGEVRFGPGRLHLVRHRNEQRERLTIEFVKRCADNAQTYNKDSMRLWHTVIREPFFW